MKTSLKTNMILGFLAVLVISAISAYTTYYYTNKAEEALKHVAKINLPNSILLSKMQESILQIRLSLNMMVRKSNHNDQAFQKIKNHIAEENAHIKKSDTAYNEVPFVDGEEAVYNVFAADLKAFQEAADFVFKFISDNGFSEETMTKYDLLLSEKVLPTSNKLNDSLQNLLDFQNEKEAPKWQQKADADGKMAEMVSLGSLTLNILLGLSIAWFMSGRISKQLLIITNSVSDASMQVNAASVQLSNAAEQLSSASQEQAASTEETSASLTEISGMVEANVHGAEKANEIARDVYGVSEDTKKTMEELKLAMGSILESNGRIEQLVKVIEEIGEKTEVIDDIVFKTQLLSFNASVEAERAGEHGRGFAVVAQEVGNLAQMSGKAATEIASIVKNSIKEASSIAGENKSRVEKGEHLAATTGEKMAKVLASVNLIVESTSKIVAASKEQNQGISQISSSVDQINQSTQQIASTSEESASASEELSGQAQSLLSLVDELRMLVTGNNVVEEKKANISTIGTNKPKPLINEDKKVLVLPERNKRTQLATNNTPSIKQAAGAEMNSGDDEWEKL